MTLVRQFASSRWTRVFMTVAFLFVMLVEWGSHSLAFAHAEPVKGMVSISQTGAEHDDPCRTTVCCESRKNDQKAPGFSHDLFPYGSVLDRADGAPACKFLPENPAIPRGATERISRPKDPLLHPPEFS